MSDLQIYTRFLELTGFDYYTLQDTTTGVTYLRSKAFSTDKVQVVTDPKLELTAIFNPHGGLVASGIDSHNCGLSKTNKEVYSKFDE